MTETQLKNRLGVFLIVSHFSAIVLIFVLWLLGGFLFEEMTTAIALIVPMFSIYTTAIIKYIIDNKIHHRRREKKLSDLYVFLAFLVPSIFIATLMMTILLKSLNLGFSSFEQFKIMLGVIQTVFGAYIGIILSSLFDVKLEPSNSAKSYRDPNG